MERRKEEKTKLDKWSKLVPPADWLRSFWRSTFARCHLYLTRFISLILLCKGVTFVPLILSAGSMQPFCDWLIRVIFDGSDGWELPCVPCVGSHGRTCVVKCQPGRLGPIDRPSENGRQDQDCKSDLGTFPFFVFCVVVSFCTELRDAGYSTTVLAPSACEFSR